MITTDFKTRLKLLLRDDVESFFKVMQDINLNSLENEILLLEAAYKELNKSKRNGLISEDFANLKYNQIIYAGLEFVDKLSSDFEAHQLGNEVNFTEAAKSNEESYKKLQKEYFDFANHVLRNALVNYGLFIYEISMSGFFELEMILREISLAELDNFFKLKKLHKYLKKQRKKLLMNNELDDFYRKFELMDDYTPKSEGDRKMIFSMVEDYFFELQGERLIKLRQREFLKHHRTDNDSYIVYLNYSIDFSKWRIKLFDRLLEIFKQYTEDVN